METSFENRSSLIIKLWATIWLLLAFAVASKAQTAQKVHVVQKGDTPYSIARSHGVYLDKLYEWNPVIKVQPLSIGQEIILVDPSKNLVTAPKKSLPTYLVEEGDTYYGLSKKFKVSLIALQELNEGELKVGQTIVLPEGAKKQEATENHTATKESHQIHETSNRSASHQTTEIAASEPGPAIQRKKAVLTDQGVKESSTNEDDFDAPSMWQASKVSGGFAGSGLEKDQEAGTIDPNEETKDYDSEFSLTENRVVTRSKAHMESSNRILFIPFDPLLYLSDADEEIANACGLQRHEVRKYFRRRLNVLVDPDGYETIKLLGGRQKDSLKDLDRIYASLEYNYEEILNDEEARENGQSKVLGHKYTSGKKMEEWISKTKDKLTINPHKTSARSTDYSDKYFSVRLNGDEFLTYFNQKYDPDYYLFITQFEVKTVYNNTQERAANIFTRKFIAHYAVLNNTGKQIAGNRIEIHYDSNARNIKKLVDDNMIEIAEKLNKAIPGVSILTKEIQ